MQATDLAGLVESHSFTEVGIGLATINALLPRHPKQWVELNAEDYLAEHGTGKNIAVVGHFPFVDRLKALANKFWVLELAPRDGDFPAQAAPEIIPPGGCGRHHRHDANQQDISRSDRPVPVRRQGGLDWPQHPAFAAAV
jgi:hypothetical protein